MKLDSEQFLEFEAKLAKYDLYPVQGKDGLCISMIIRSSQYPDFSISRLCLFHSNGSRLSCYYSEFNKILRKLKQHIKDYNDYQAA